MKFKVGDKIKAIDDEKYNVTTKKNEWEGIVTKVEEKSFEAKTIHTKNGYDIGHEYTLEYEYFEKDEFTRNDLQDGDRITLRNGKVGYYSKDMDIDSLRKCNIEDDLTNNGSCGKELDIVKVERPVKYRTVYERKEVKEMTIAEISEALGYEVKVIKE